MIPSECEKLGGGEMSNFRVFQLCNAVKFSSVSVKISSIAV